MAVLLASSNQNFLANEPAMQEKAEVTITTIAASGKTVGLNLSKSTSASALENICLPVFSVTFLEIGTE